MPRKKRTAAASSHRRRFGFANFAAAFPAALMNGRESAALLTAAGFVVAELIFAAWANLPTLPFILCAGGFITLILTSAARLRSSASASGRNGGTRSDVSGLNARLLALLLMTKFIGVVVTVTGGSGSPFAATMFLPVFVGALYFGVAGSAAVGVAILSLFLLLSVWEPTAFTPSRSDVLQGLVFLSVSLFAGLMVRRLEQTAQTAQIRAKQQADRAARFEWLNDTSVMMESLLDLEPMLAAGLLRVDELVPSSTIAIFLREPDGPDFLLAQTLGIGDEAVGLRRIALADQEIVQQIDHSSVLFWTNHYEVNKNGAGVFVQMDKEAQSVLLVPLGTYGDLFGVLYLGRHGEETFTQHERDDLVQMARHIVYPIQRVRLHALALTDALTGLSNRRAFRRRLLTEVERATRYRHSLSLLMFDIDHFKQANDTLGHRAGDALLTQIGGILHRACRGIDMAARYGGEEMVIICPETSETEAVRVAERVRVAVAEHVFLLPNGGNTKLTISAGVASLPLDGGDAPSLVEAADAALYDAKQSGRNRVSSAQAIAAKNAASEAAATITR